MSSPAEGCVCRCLSVGRPECVCVCVCVFRRLDSSCLKWTPNLLISRYASFVCVFVCLCVSCLLPLAVRLANRQQERSLRCFRRQECLETSNWQKEGEKTAGKPETWDVWLRARARHCSQHCCARAHFAHLLPSDASVAFYFGGYSI